MKVALGQFAVGKDWQANLEKCVEFMLKSEAEGAAVLEAQPVDGPFMREILAVSRDLKLATVFTIHLPTDDGKVMNSLMVIQKGEIIAQYDKLHLYDAFSVKESDSTKAGESIPVRAQRKFCRRKEKRPGLLSENL